MGALIYNNRFLGFYSIQYLPVSNGRGVLLIRGWGREISENLINREFLISGGLEKYEFFKTRRRYMKGKNCIHYIRHTIIAIPFNMTDVNST